MEPEAPESDPLVDIRNQELQLKAADLQRKQSEFDAKQAFNEEKERNDVSGSSSSALMFLKPL